MKIFYKTPAGVSVGAPVVHVNPMQLVILLLMQVEPVIGIALYSANAILHGDDVWEIVQESFI
jgi:pyruvate dehydrogenase (quinone)